MKKLLLLFLLIPNLAFALPPCEEKPWNNCVGTLTWKDGTMYIGEFKNGKYSGQGTMNFADGGIYKGKWKNNQLNGHGTYIYPNGTTYTGEFKNSLKNGQGIYTFANGDVYSGEWKNDKRHGIGTNRYANGDEYTFEWENDKKVKRIFADNKADNDPKNEQESNNTDIDDKKLLPAASGSGFAISKDGYILTNNHVISGCQALNIHTNGKLLPARIIAKDPINDLALIKGNFKPQTVFYINSSSPRLLDDIYVAGYPFGYAVSSSIKMTTGIISSLSGIGNNTANMQIDAAVQPGNSGGPVVDKKGNVVGVAVAKLDVQAAFENFGAIPENTNFAIKSSTARTFAESNNISLIKKNAYKGSDLGSYIENGTYYLSCMMTMAKIKELGTQKVFFQNITK